MQEFGDVLTAAAESALKVHEEIHGEEIKRMYSLFNMLTRTQNLCQLRDLLQELGDSLAKADISYLELKEACDTVSRSCDDAARICACKAKEARDKKNATRIIGGATSRLALGAGAALMTTAAVATGELGAGAVDGAVGAAGTVTTHCIARDFASSEASFQSIQRDFDRLLQFALNFTLKEGVARVHTNLESISTMADTIAQCTKNGLDCSVVQDALKRLNVACERSHATTSKCSESVKGKIKELKRKT